MYIALEWSRWPIDLKRRSIISIWQNSLYTLVFKRDFTGLILSSCCPGAKTIIVQTFSEHISVLDMLRNDVTLYALAR